MCRLRSRPTRPSGGLACPVGQRLGLDRPVAYGVVPVLRAVSFRPHGGLEEAALVYVYGSVRCVTACAESSLGSAAHSHLVLSVGPSFGLQRRFGVRAEVTLVLVGWTGRAKALRVLGFIRP